MGKKLCQKGEGHTLEQKSCQVVRMETNLLYLESDTMDHNSPAITRKSYIKSRRRTAQFQGAGGKLNSRRQSGQLKNEKRNLENI